MDNVVKRYFVRWDYRGGISKKSFAKFADFANMKFDGLNDRLKGVIAWCKTVTESELEIDVRENDIDLIAFNLIDSNESGVRLGVPFQVEGKMYLITKPTNPSQEINDHGHVVILLQKI